MQQAKYLFSAADAAHLKQLLDLCSPLGFFRTMFSPCHNVNLHPGASILHLDGGLHKFRDGHSLDAFYLGKIKYMVWKGIFLCAHS